MRCRLVWIFYERSRVRIGLLIFDFFRCLNGVIAVPIMAAMMIVVSRRQEMGDFIATRSQRVFGWAATAVMAIAAIAMMLLQ